MYLVSREQIKQCDITDPTVARRLIEGAFRQKAAGGAVAAQEVAMSVGAREDGSFYSLPAYLAEERIAGIKWTSHVPRQQAHLPYTQPVILLNDLLTGTPIALLEGELISGLRTGAVSGAAVGALSNGEASSLLLCGSGFQAKHQLKSLVAALPKLKTVHLWSRTFAHAEKLRNDFGGLWDKNGIAVQLHQKLPDKLDFAEIVVGATSAAVPYLHASHFVPGHLYVHIGMRDIDEEAVKSFDEIICDDYEAGVPSSSQSLFGTARKIPAIADRVSLLETLLLGRKQCSGLAGKKTMFNAFGLPIFDLVLANAALNQLRDEAASSIQRFAL
ncbi:hypothetical protein ACX93W_16115 [Paenibacillus sp. CAU 1782]